MSVNLGKILSSSEYDCHSFSEKNKEELDNSLTLSKSIFDKIISM